LPNNKDSQLEWRENDLPVSIRFDDPYYSKADGRAETSHVFIDSNNLPARWPDMQTCTIAELGFGTGLNFLETVRQWRLSNARNSKLHFISFEQFPISKADMQKALSNWPELNELNARLVELWKPAENIIDVEFSENIALTVHMQDANACLPQLRFLADVWYLDGFSPAKNPELWNENLMLEVANHTKQNGTFATYTSAGFVKRGLTAAGFIVEKTKGFGMKREMLIGKKQRI